MEKTLKRRRSENMKARMEIEEGRRDKRIGIVEKVDPLIR
jgi:hypothetical protein